ncbi:MAG: hypothetical protein ABSH56_23385 [Bryobacteraceae bacterium]|jgi:hypothetical protein
MPGAQAWFDSAAGAVTLLLAGVLAGLVGILGYRAWKRSRVPPEERERRRRAWLVATGKMCDAALVDLREELVFYSYSVRGVEYTASQDVSQLGAYLPSEKEMITVIAVRFDPANPANSIVISEEWSGLR